MIEPRRSRGERQTVAAVAGSRPAAAGWHADEDTSVRSLSRHGDRHRRGRLRAVPGQRPGARGGREMGARTRRRRLDQRAGRRGHRRPHLAALLDAVDPVRGRRPALDRGRQPCARDRDGGDRAADLPGPGAQALHRHRGAQVLAAQRAGAGRRRSRLGRDAGGGDRRDRGIGGGCGGRRPGDRRALRRRALCGSRGDRLGADGPRTLRIRDPVRGDGGDRSPGRRYPGRRLLGRRQGRRSDAAGHAAAHGDRATGQGDRRGPGDGRNRCGRGRGRRRCRQRDRGRRGAQR